MEELLFVVDASDRPLAPVARSEVIENNLWRRACGILVINADFRQILCHKRTSTKDERPSVWVSMFGGKCDTGETPNQTVLRELREESSIVLNEDQLNFFAKVKSDKHHQFEYLYWASWNGNINSLTYNPEEVQEIKWFDIDSTYSNLELSVDGWYCYSPEELAMIGHLGSLAN